jgi:hypothetical protein
MKIAREHNKKKIKILRFLIVGFIVRAHSVRALCVMVKTGK